MVHTSALIPVAYRRREPDGSSLTLVGPGFFKRRPGDEGWNAGLVPLLFAGRKLDRRHQIAVPLFWRFTGPESNFTLAGPVLWRRRGESRLGGVLPLALAGRWNGTRFATIPPLLFHHHSKQTGERFTMAGLYTGWSSPEGGTAHSV